MDRDFESDRDAEADFGDSASVSAGTVDSGPEVPKTGSTRHVELRVPCLSACRHGQESSHRLDVTGLSGDGKFGVTVDGKMGVASAVGGLARFQDILALDNVAQHRGCINVEAVRQRVDEALRALAVPNSLN